MNKKGNGYLYIVFTVIAAVVVAVGGQSLGFWDFSQAPTGSDVVPTAKDGDLGTLKFSVETDSQDIPVQYVTTGYCWDVVKPTSLIESRNGKTTSASAGTSFSPAYRGSTYSCTAIDANHICDAAQGSMVDEGLELRATCKNISRTSGQVSVSFYEQGTQENTVSLTVPASSTKSYNKFALEASTANLPLSVGGICVGTNTSTSRISQFRIEGWNKISVPDSLTGEVDDYCFEPKGGAQLLDTFEFTEYANSWIWTANADTAVAELFTYTILPACDYVSKDGSVKRGIAKDDPSESLCTDQGINGTITIANS